jgi:hypothetical protein
MIDRTQFSAKLLTQPEAESEAALERIALAKRRIQSVLDRETVACQKTLEQKISDQGPTDMRVDPALVGKAILDLREQRRFQTHTHPTTGNISWYSNRTTFFAAVNARLATLAPLYDRVSGHGFGNLTGDALELVVWKALRVIEAANPRYAYQGHFDISKPKDQHQRYRRIQPPKTMGEYSTLKEADFFQFGHGPGALCIECKNMREWFYPEHPLIKELIIKASDLNMIPLLVARRIHYATRSNLLKPAGIIAHESLYQYYPADQHALAEQVKHARSLGFTDVLAAEDPHPRTVRFFSEILPSIVEPMAERWNAHKEALVAFAREEMPLAQLYSEIDSPAGGKWIPFD